MRVHALVAPSARLDVAAPGIGYGRPVPDGVDVLVAGVPTEDELGCVRTGGAFVLPFAGLPATTLGRLRERPDLRVYNLHHNADLVAEHAVALLLAASRCLIEMDRALRRGDWTPRYAPDPSPALRGQRALILGHGAIGQRVGAILSALGMEVHATRRRGPFTARVHRPESVDPWLGEVRALVVTLPHTAATDRWVDAARLARLPPEAVVVNVGRGAVIDETALFEALRDRRIHAAAIDTWWRYPEADKRDATPAATVPFHELNNVVLSPHRAAHALETEEVRMVHLARVLSALSAGEEPACRVDLDAGY